MNSRHLESHNLTTPMGTIPISVIYGFEYPCQNKSSTRRYERSELVQVTSRCRVGESDNLKMKRKSRGCLTEIKKYRKPNLISSTANTISVTRVNRSGTETRTQHCSLHSKILYKQVNFIIISGSYNLPRSYSRPVVRCVYKSSNNFYSNRSWYRRARSHMFNIWKMYLISFHSLQSLLTELDSRILFSKV